MAGFFRTVRDHLRTEFSGRYLALLLQELGNREPHSFKALLDSSSLRSLHCAKPLLKSVGSGDAILVREYNCSHKRRRFADLALIDKQHNPLLLVEIKEGDFTNPKNAAQLADYATKTKTLCKTLGSKVGFVHISRYEPVAQDRAIITRLQKARLGAVLYYREIYDRLRSLSPVRQSDMIEGQRSRKLKLNHDNHHPIAGMICDYLEDIGVTHYRNIDGDEGSLKLLAISMLGGGDLGEGRLRTHANIDGIPQCMNTLFTNLSVFGEAVRNKNSAIFRQRFNRGVVSRPWVDKGLIKDLKSSSDNQNEIASSRIVGGYVYFFARANFSNHLVKKRKKGFFLALEIGYRIDIDKPRSQKSTDEGASGIDMHFYSTVEWQGIEADALDGVHAEANCNPFRETGSKFPISEAHAMQVLTRCVEKTRLKAIHFAPNEMKSALRALKVP